MSATFSRLARNQEDLGWIRNRLKSHRKQAIEASSGLDLDNIGARVMGVMSEEYLEKVRQDTHRGLRGRFDRGLATGGCPFGYRTVPIITGEDRHGRLITDGFRLEVEPDRSRKRLRVLRDQRAQTVRECEQARVMLPTLGELMPLVRAKIQEMESILTRDAAQGRLALGALLAGERLRVYRDGPIEGSAILRKNELAAMGTKSSGRQASVVAGGLRNGRDGEGARDAASDARLRPPRFGPAFAGRPNDASGKGVNVLQDGVEAGDGTPLDEASLKAEAHSATRRAARARVP